MTWVKLDDSFVDHFKLEKLSDGAFRTHVSALCDCSRNLTDGFVATARVKRLVPRFRKTYIDELTSAEPGSKPLWHPVEGGWQIHDYLDFQPSAEKVKADRAAAAERQRLARDKASSRTPSQRESQRDKRRDSQRDIQRESQGSHTGSHGPPVPSRPLPPPTSSAETSVTDPTQVAAGAAPEEDIWTLLATRRLAHERDNGTTIRQPDSYRATCAHNYRDELQAEAKQLITDYPHWTLSRLADELDPDTAVQVNHHIPDQAATLAAIKEREALGHDPCPPELKAQLQASRYDRSSGPTSATSATINPEHR